MPNAPKKTMVCVTVQKTCERLIRAGASLAGGAGLSVVHVARSGEALLGGSSESEALEYLFRISREYGAEMDMLRSDDVIDTCLLYTSPLPFPLPRLCLLRALWYTLGKGKTGGQER